MAVTEARVMPLEGMETASANYFSRCLPVRERESGIKKQKEGMFLFFVLVSGRCEHADKLEGGSQKEHLMIQKSIIKINGGEV